MLKSKIKTLFYAYTLATSCASFANVSTLEAYLTSGPIDARKQVIEITQGAQGKWSVTTHFMCAKYPCQQVQPKVLSVTPLTKEDRRDTDGCLVVELKPTDMVLTKCADFMQTNPYELNLDGEKIEMHMIPSIEGNL